jgi:hypothetical protein
MLKNVNLKKKQIKQASRKPGKRKKTVFLMEHVSYVHVPILK